VGSLVRAGDGGRKMTTERTKPCPDHASSRAIVARPSNAEAYHTASLAVLNKATASVYLAILIKCCMHVGLPSYTAPDGCILCPPGEYEKVSEELEQSAMRGSGANETLALSHGRDTQGTLSKWHRWPNTCRWVAFRAQHWTSSYPNQTWGKFWLTVMRRKTRQGLVFIHKWHRKVCSRGQGRK